MDQGKILLLNLAKGRIGEDNGARLGALFITKIQLAANTATVPVVRAASWAAVSIPRARPETITCPAAPISDESEIVIQHLSLNGGMQVGVGR